MFLWGRKLFKKHCKNKIIEIRKKSVRIPSLEWARYQESRSGVRWQINPAWLPEPYARE